MSVRGFRPLAVWIAGVALAVEMTGCRSSAIVPALSQDDVGVNAPSLLLSEVMVRSLASDVLTRVQTHDAGSTAVRVDGPRTCRQSASAKTAAT